MSPPDNSSHSNIMMYQKNALLNPKSFPMADSSMLKREWFKQLNKQKELRELAKIKK
jgi:hypothetical protein